MYTPILFQFKFYYKPRLYLMFFLYMGYTFSSTKSYDMHYGVHDWLINSSEMVIYAFLLGFFSPYNQKHVTIRSKSCDQKL